MTSRPIPMAREKLTKDDLEFYLSMDNFFIRVNGKEYNVGQFQSGYGVYDEDLNKTPYKDFEDIWENCKIDGIYLRDMIDDLECAVA